MQTAKNYFKVIQISDAHLFKDPKQTIFGISSNNNFDMIFNIIKNSELDDTNAIFLTGDLSQDETAESYNYLFKKIQSLNKPTYWIPGNHDSILQMEKIFNQSSIFQRGMKLSTDFWDFIFIDSKITDKDTGFIQPSELKRLAHELNETKKDKVAIIMHHHPIEVNTPLIDKYILENRQDFWKIIADFKADLIICGHVHNDYSIIANNTFIETAPATCLQWQKGTTEFSLENKPGYKVYYFLENSYEAKAKFFNI